MAPGVPREYLSALLAALGREHGHHGATKPTSRQRPIAQSLLEPLSERELEVLRLLATGLSNSEIAQRLVVTVHTVKWHTKNLYGKLDATNRAQAIVRARSLGLIDS